MGSWLGTARASTISSYVQMDISITWLASWFTEFGFIATFKFIKEVANGERFLSTFILVIGEAKVDAKFVQISLKWFVAAFRAFAIIVIYGFTSTINLVGWETD